MANIYDIETSDIISMVSDADGMGEAAMVSRELGEPVVLWDHRGWHTVYPDGETDESD